MLWSTLDSCYWRDLYKQDLKYLKSYFVSKLNIDFNQESEFKENPENAEKNPRKTGENPEKIRKPGQLPEKNNIISY